jgi:hypothetical protein
MADVPSPSTPPTNDGNINTTPTATRTRSVSRVTRPPSATRSTRSGASETSVTETEPSAPSSPAEHDNDSLTNPLEEAPALPCYLLRTIARIELLSLDDVEEETNEVGDGGDSDVEGDDLTEHDEAMKTVILERLATEADDDGNDIVDDGDSNCILLKKGSHPEIKIPGIPDNWVPPHQKVEKGEPNFDEIDNPGKWCNFTFRPEFGAHGGAYTKHTLSTGATPVPEVDGKRCRGPWEFFYQGYKGEGRKRDGSTRENLFPPTRKGMLNEALLKRMGLTEERMTTGDALFFHQLLLPICDPKRSGIQDDPRKPFYSEVERFSNIYAFGIGLGGSYGHTFKTITLDELVRYDGVVVRDGVRGGSNGALHRRWMECADHDDEIDQSMRHGRWLQIKRVVKLCNNDGVPKRGEEGYDPAYKYDMLWEALFANVNAITKHAELDLCGDETTWGHGGFGEAGSGLVGRIMGKPGISKGGQIVMISDVNRIRPRAYVHRHKLHTKPPGWTTQGPSEVRKIMEMITPMVVGEETSGGQRQIYRRKPHGTWDNFFSGEVIMKWLGENGFGTTMTCRRDRLPRDIPAENLHKKKTSSDSRPKAARFHQPIVAVQNVAPDGENEGYQRIHVSFQSTSSCNLSTVNALNECSMFIRKKERGRGASKRQWGIEMNDARQMYLQSYFRIDTIDHLISNCNMFYRSWKYWHSPMIHGKALAVVVAYDMYLECTEGDLDPVWKVEKPMDFWSFREKLSEQMLQYKPTRRKYPGDSNMRAATQQSRRARQERTDATNQNLLEDMTQAGDEDPVDDGNPINKSVLQRAIGRRGKSRLCGNLSHFERHVQSVVTGKKHPLSCRVCGDHCYSVCTMCDKPLHFFPNRGKNVGKNCFLEYHNDSFFGLAVDDCKVMKKRKQDWTAPTVAKKKVQARHIDSLKAPPP